MANMSYCRFQNTVSDLRDCLDHMDDDPEEMNDGERRARRRLIKLCVKIGLDYAEEMEQPIQAAAAQPVTASQGA